MFHVECWSSVVGRCVSLVGCWLSFGLGCVYVSSFVCLLCVACCVLINVLLGGCCVLCVVTCVLFVVFVIIVRCLFVVACCLLIVACCLLCVGCCVLSCFVSMLCLLLVDGRWLLFVVCRCCCWGIVLLVVGWLMRFVGGSASVVC